MSHDACLNDLSHGEVEVSQLHLAKKKRSCWLLDVFDVGGAWTLVSLEALKDWNGEK